MKPRCFGRMVFAAALGLTVTMASSSSAQQVRRADAVSRYVDGLLAATPNYEHTPKFEETWGELTELISDKCAEVARSDRQQMMEQLQWLGRVQAQAEGHLERATQLITDTQLGVERGRITREAGDATIGRALANLSDARMECAVTALVVARVFECMQTRARALGGGTWMTGTWWAKCSAAPGITPADYGRLTLQIVGDTVQGTVYPGADTAGAEVTGPIATHGTFSAGTAPGKGQQVRVSGQISRFGPLVGNGTIVLSGEVQGQGKWECVGSWRND